MLRKRVPDVGSGNRKSSAADGSQSALKGNSTNTRSLITVFPHDERVATSIARGEVYLGYDEQQSASALRVDGPRTLHVRRILARPVGTLDEAAFSGGLASTRSVCCTATTREQLVISCMGADFSFFLPRAKELPLSPLSFSSLLSPLDISAAYSYRGYG